MSNHGRDEYESPRRYDVEGNSYCPEYGDDGSNVNPEQFIEWKEGLPTEAGEYWFWGYRFGKSEDNPKKELLFMRVVGTSGSFMFIADGNFIFRSQVEEPMFRVAVVPQPPEEK